MIHKKLDIWKKSIELVAQIYQVTQSFLKEELYGLTNQLRRAAVSVPSNIAEGSARASKKELIQFLYIALGSLSELETQIIIAGKLGFITTGNTNENTKNVDESINLLMKMLSSLIKTLKTQINSNS